MEMVVGTVVRDGIRLVRKLGSGAMGSVWVAEHAGLSTEVAVKLIHRDLILDDEGQALKRFQREAHAAAQIKSPHVVTVFDAGVTATGTPFIVMELLEGEDLGARLGQRPQLELPEVGEIVAQVALALDKAHERGIIHRDIKPENIFLLRGDDRALAKVLDFGVAKLDRWGGSGKLTNPEQLVGTPAYLSREAILAEPTDHRVDLWALSVVAYEALTGRLPFQGASMALICVAICEGVFTPPSVLRPELSPRVDAFFERAFHFDPTQRFESARQLARELLLTMAELESDVASIDQALLASGRFNLPPSVRPAVAQPGLAQGVRGPLASAPRPSRSELDPEPAVAAPMRASSRRWGSATGAVVIASVVALAISAAVAVGASQSSIEALRAAEPPARAVEAPPPEAPRESATAQASEAPPARAEPPEIAASASAPVPTLQRPREARGGAPPPPAPAPNSVAEAENQLGF